MALHPSRAPVSTPAARVADRTGEPPFGAAELELPVAAVEERLTALGLALHQQDPQAVEREAAGLHTALAIAVAYFARAAQSGGVPAALRHRLALATGQMAAQREALSRATASLDRAIDVLIPGVAASRSVGLYSTSGHGTRRSGRGSALA